MKSEITKKADLLTEALAAYFTEGVWEAGSFGIADHGAEGVDIWGPNYGPCTIDGDPSVYKAAEAVVTARLAGNTDALSNYTSALFE